MYDIVLLFTGSCSFFAGSRSFFVRRNEDLISCGDDFSVTHNFIGPTTAGPLLILRGEPVLEGGGREGGKEGGGVKEKERERERERELEREREEERG